MNQVINSNKPATTNRRGVSTMDQSNLTQQELIGKCFGYLNAFKRHRALANIKRQEGLRDNANYHELKAYQLIDSLELGLRAIQKGQRDIDSSMDESDE